MIWKCAGTFEPDQKSLLIREPIEERESTVLTVGEHDGGISASRIDDTKF